MKGRNINFEKINWIWIIGENIMEIQESKLKENNIKELLKEKYGIELKNQ